jgi:hypothetical protein
MSVKLHSKHGSLEIHPLVNVINGSAIAQLSTSSSEITLMPYVYSLHTY